MGLGNTFDIANSAQGMNNSVGVSGGASNGGGSFMGMLGGLLGPVAGLLGNKAQNRYNQRMAKQQFDWQRQLMQQQYTNQGKLNRQGHDLSFEMWEKTNYPAQMQMLKEAGLNPALLYGNGGGPGGTTQQSGGGSASGGNAPSIAPMELNMQLASMMKDLKLKDAQAEKLIAETETERGDNSRGMQEIIKLGEDIANVKSKTALNDIGYAIQEAEYDLIPEKLAILQNDREISDFTKDDIKKKVMYEAINEEFESQLKSAKIDLTREQERKIWHDIWQGWLSNGLKGLDTIVKGRLKSIGSMGK